MIKSETVLIALLAIGFSNLLHADSVDITVRHAPHLISTNKDKRESAWASCRYCGSKTNYERTYRWDVYNQGWVETTKSEDVPQVCRKCRLKLKDQEKLKRRERDLDRRIEYERTRIRIKDKKETLKDLRRDAR